MRAQHLVTLAILSVVVCYADSSAILREHKEPIPSIWRRLKHMPKEQMKFTLDTLMRRSQRNALDDKIIAIIEACIQNPALDPIEIPYINIAINEDFANFTGHMDTVSVDGISTLTVDNFHIGLLLMKVDFAFTLPSLTMRGNYDLDGVFAGLLPIYGKGPFTLSVSNFTVKGIINAKIGAGSTILIKSMSIELGLDDFLFDFKYLLGSEELSDVVNEIINDLGLAFMNKYKLSIETAISETLTTAVNGSGITIGDITGGDGGGGPGFCTAA